jgi:hypothetical protein
LIERLIFIVDLTLSGMWEGKCKGENLQYKSLLTSTITFPSSTAIYSQMMFWEQSHGGNANTKFYVKLIQIQ